MIIDIAAHHIPRSVRQLIKKSGFYDESMYHQRGVLQNRGFEMPYPANNADPEVRLELMDKYDIDIQVLSQTVPVVLGSDPDEAAEICKLSNNANYALCKSYPKRFVNLCIISLLDVDSAMKELARALNELDSRGATVASNQNGKGLDSPEYFRFYEKLVEHDVPLFIQPTNWEFYPLVNSENGLGALHIFGWPFDTTQAVWRLILGGVIDRYPSLKIITHHCGGMIPYFAQRMERTIAKRLSRQASEYWDNIYGDTVLSGSLAACRCGYAFFGSERMLYGSDYPFCGEAGVRDNLTCIKALDISPEDMKKISGLNVKALLKIS